jgi:hypothetical protein
VNFASDALKMRDQQFAIRVTRMEYRNAQPTQLFE